MARCRYNSRPYAHGKGALEVTGPGSGARSSPTTHTHLYTGCMRRESAGGRVEHRAIRQGKGCFQAYWGDNTLYHKDSKSLREPGEGLAEESYHHTPCRRVRRAARRQTGATMRNITGGHYYNVV
eukprot:gene8114-5650_t